MRSDSKRLLLLALLVPLLAWADHDGDDDDEGDEDGNPGQRAGRGARPASLPPGPARTAWATECGACHLAFPPSLLPARSWKALLGTLDDHFGENAEVDAATRAQLETFLVTNAGREVPGPTPLRITGLRWWRHEHDELGPAVFARKAVASPANCGACHPGAERGVFSEHAVKVPRDAPPPR